MLLPAAQGHVRGFGMTCVVNRCRDNRRPACRPGGPDAAAFLGSVTSHFAFLQGLLPPETRRGEETLSVNVLDVCHLILIELTESGFTWESFPLRGGKKKLNETSWILH